MIQLDWNIHRLPLIPAICYQCDGYTSVADFLGNNNFKNIDFIPYSQARLFVKKLKLKGQKEWKSYSKSGKRPDNIHSHPYRIYKNKGWISLSDFLGYKK